MIEVAVATVLIAGMAWDILRRALSRRSDEYTRLTERQDALEKSLRAEQTSAYGEWQQNFDSADQRLGRLEQTVKGLEPKFQPLGRAYNPRA
jgi:hypothetical protein